jgi:hypothetical protein
MLRGAIPVGICESGKQTPCVSHVVVVLHRRSVVPCKTGYCSHLLLGGGYWSRTSMKELPFADIT